MHPNNEVHLRSDLLMGKYAVINPASGETVKEFPDATAADIEAALAAAQQTYTEWSRNTTVTERAALAQRAAERFYERQDELGAIINRQMGKPLDQAVGCLLYTSRCV